MKVAQELEINAVIFLLNDDTGTLLGPFTAAQRPEDLEKGAWYSSVEKHAFSGNVRVEWERLHELKNATDNLPFLKDTRNCALTHLQTQELLAALKNAPLYSESKS